MILFSIVVRAFGLSNKKNLKKFDLQKFMAENVESLANKLDHTVQCDLLLGGEW